MNEGTHTFNDDAFGSVNTVRGGSVFIGGNFTARTATGVYDLDGRILTIERARIGEDYIIDFEGTAEGGIAITAHYRGPLESPIIDITTGNPTPLGNVR